MKIVAFLVRYSRGLAALALTTGLISGLCTVALFAIINTTLGNRGFANSRVALYFVGVALLLMVMRVISTNLLSYLAQNAMRDLRMQLSRQILSAPLRDLEEIGAHRLIASLTNDVANISSGIFVIQTLCLQGTVLVGSMIYLISLSWTIFLGVFVFIVGATGIYQIAVGRAITYIRQGREQQDSLFKHFRAMTEGSKELKLHQRRREAFFDDVLQPTVNKFRRSNIIGNAIFAMAASGGQLMIFTLVGLLLFALPLIQNVDSMVLIGYAFTISYIVVPVEIITSLLPNLSSASISLSKIESLGLSLTGIKVEDASASAPRLQKPWGTLEFSGVTYSYYREREASVFTLGPVDLTLTPGEIVFLTGGNGSGKTSFAKLLVGLYIPEAGEIRLDGAPLTDENRDAYRQNFSVVFADFYLFETLLGLETPQLDEKARDYLMQLQLDHKVQVSDGRLSTTELSQGQRKRLALLTAYLEDRPVYLFDEWAADQDPFFKEIFYLQILPELKARGKTVFVISHDDRYYHLADRLIKFEDGNVEYDRKMSCLPDGSLEPAHNLNAVS